MKISDLCRFTFLSLMLAVLVGFASNTVFAQTSKPGNTQQEADRLAREAYASYQNQDYATAITKCNQAIRYAPNYHYAYYLKGSSQFELSQFNEALQSLNMAATLGYKPIQDVYLQRWKVNYNLGNLAAVETDLREVARLSPKDAETRIILVDILRSQKKYADAIKYANEVKAIDPNNGDVYFYTALVYNEQRNYLYGTTEAVQAIKLKSKYAANAKVLIGGNLTLYKKYTDAITYFQDALRDKPDLLDAYYGLSTTYQSLNQFDKAIEALQKAATIRPKEGTTYINLSFIYSLAGYHQKAVEAGKLAMQYAPQNHMGYTNTCRAYNDLKQFDSAISTCNQALDLSPDDGETYLYLAGAYKSKSNTVKAKQLYEKAAQGLEEFTRGNPDYADGFYLLGNAYFENGQWGKAILSYQKCLELNENFVKAHLNLGLTFVKIDDLRSAREQLNKLKVLDPQRATQLLNIIQAQAKAKN